MNVAFPLVVFVLLILFVPTALSLWTESHFYVRIYADDPVLFLRVVQLHWTFFFFFFFFLNSTVGLRSVRRQDVGLLLTRAAVAPELFLTHCERQPSLVI